MQNQFYLLHNLGTFPKVSVVSLLIGNDSTILNSSNTIKSHFNSSCDWVIPLSPEVDPLMVLPPVVTHTTMQRAFLGVRYFTSPTEF